jgi:arsenate reductase
MQIWHNPRCSKSRQTLALLQRAGIEPEIRRYLDNPPTVDELRAVLRALGRRPWELVRMKEEEAKGLDLAAWPKEDARWLQLMAEHPKLIERPVVIAADGRAILGRPPSNVQELL